MNERAPSLDLKLFEFYTLYFTKARVRLSSQIVVKLIFTLTVQFHVDNLKASYKEQALLEHFLKDLRDEFGQADELTKNKGLVHEYLGITIDYSIWRKVVFTMFDYLEDVIVEARQDLKKTVVHTTLGMIPL